MLSRVVLRSFQTPLARPAAVNSRIVSTVWSRSIARHNKPNHNKNAPTNHTKPSLAHQQPKAKQPSNQNQNPIPKRSVGANAAASPVGNTSSQTPAGVRQNEKAEPSVTEPAEAEPVEFQLPDLTRGIPSTLEYERAGGSGTFKAAKGSSPLNLTEAEDPTESGGGRTGGQLPASAYVSSNERKRLMVANYMYASFVALLVSGTIYLGRNWDTEEEEKKHEKDAPSGWAVGLMWKRAKARLGDQVNYYSEPAFEKLLPDLDPLFERPYTLVLSLEDLLIHSEWTREHGWRMAKRPGLDYFLRYLSQYYEIVIFTSQPFAMAEPVIRKLDPFHMATWPLFREATRYENGDYVKVCSYSQFSNMH